MGKHIVVICLGILVTGLLPAARLWADVSGSVYGTVTDPTGAAVPGATVTLRNPNTGYTRHSTSDPTGSYEFVSVPVGEKYVVEVEARGFQKSSQSDLTLLVNQRFRADFQLVVGAVTQAVNISAQLVQVETASTQVGDVVEDRKMTALPLNGRSYIDLLGLQAGVVSVGSRQANLNFPKPISGLGNTGNLSVNGMQESANEFLVNGSTVEEGINNGAAIAPVLDSIQEFRLITNSFDAEYGRSAGGIVNVVTKSGTNALHGSGFEFLRNEKLDSRNFFDSERGAFKRNQFGGTVGGPIRKNRLFFFGDYEGNRETRGVSSPVLTVPSLTQRTGDVHDMGLTGVVKGDNVPGHFAQVLSSRLGYTVTPGEPYAASGCNTLAEAQAGMCVFPGGIVPQSAWSPAALATLKFIPQPNAGRSTFQTSAEKQHIRDDKFAGRVDLNSQRTGNWSIYYHFDDANVVLPFPRFTSNVSGFPAKTLSRSQLASLSNTRNFGSATVNEAHVAYLRSAFNRFLPQGGLGKISDFGFQEGGLGLLAIVPQFEGVPDISLNLLGVNFGLPDGMGAFIQNTYQVSDNLAMVKGKHSLKFGGEFRVLQVNERQAYIPNGWFQFSGGETGSDFADYLIGAPDAFFQASFQLGDARTKYGGLYAQDSYKIRTNLTFNVGVRWDAPQPFHDNGQKLETFVPGQQSKIFTGAPTGWVFPGDSGIPSTLGPTRYNNFAPRAGFAYSPSVSDGILGKLFGGPGKTSIRAAFGIFYTTNGDITSTNEAGDAPYGLFYGSPTQIFLEEPYKARRSGTDPGQRFPFVYPVPGGPVNWAQVQPLASSPGYEVDNVTPYAEQFNFNIERQVSSTALFRAAYVGTRGHHLLGQITYNPGIPSRCLQVRAILGPTSCGPFGEDSIYDLGNGQFVFGTRPFSVTSGRFLNQGVLDFGKGDWYATINNSNYNALELSFEKRAGPLRFLGAYTFSKSIDLGSSVADEMNPFNPNRNKALSDFDSTHNFVISYTYDLPLQRLSPSPTGALSKFLQGWSVTGVTRLATGFPITMTEGDDNSLCGCEGLGGIIFDSIDSGTDFPNYDGLRFKISDPRASANHHYFDVSHFSAEALGTEGNANRRFFHGPGLNNFDFAIHKTTRVTERLSLEYRAEFFNIFNHAQFRNPSGDVASATFGLITRARDPRIGQMALKLAF